MFKAPGSILFPDAHPILGFDFGRPAHNLLKVSITNLTDRSYLVLYTVYLYDSSGKRIGHENDKFAIGGRKSVAKELLLHTYALSKNPKPSRFGLALSVEQ